MGNTAAKMRRKLRGDVVRSRGSEAALRAVVGEAKARGLLDTSINKHGDTLLMLCVRHGRYEALAPLIAAGCAVDAINRDGQTVVDLLLKDTLPDNAVILHQHFCAYQRHTDMVLPWALQTLLRVGGTGDSLQRLALHLVRTPEAILQIINLLPGLAGQIRLGGLLLQLTAWFDQSDNTMVLFKRGVSVDAFWRAPFMPYVAGHSRSGSWKRRFRATSAQCSDAESTQSLKMCFAQDWKGEWDEAGGDDVAQYRAGLQLPPSCVVRFTRAANSYDVLDNIMWAVLSYRPLICDGPDLRSYGIINALAVAGYLFTAREIRRLRLKFQIDFTAYERYRQQPRSLKHACRICVRFNMRANVYYGLAQIDFLPAKMKSYLALNDCEC